LGNQNQTKANFQVNSAKRKQTYSQVAVAHACNPSYSKGRDQEDGGSKPAQINSL
jgi:hypothetical protein